MKQLKKVLCLFVFALLFFTFSGIAFASVNIEIISTPDIDTAIENREVPFSDSHGRTYEEVINTMKAQHDYLVKFAEVTNEWVKNNTFPEYFAGAYFDGTKLTIQSTSNEAAVIQTIKSLFGGDVAIASAQRSYSHLLEKKMQVIADAKDRSLDSRAWIDMKANSVVIEIAEESRRADGYAGFINRFNNAPFVIRYVDSLEVTPTRAIGNNTGCYYAPPNHTSSLGCWLTINGVNKILTAGHCSGGASGTNAKVYTSSSKSTQIGYVQYTNYNPSVDSVGDFGWILPLSSHTPATGNQLIEGFYPGGLVPQGATVIRSGKNSMSSGVVISTGEEVSYIGDTGKRTNMVKASYSTTVGESGNAVVAGDNLLCGIQGGGTGPSYFTPWSVIQPHLY